MKKSEGGFTLIELLVVIAIIALLASMIFASLSTAKQKARDANRIATARSLTTALSLYEDKNGSVIGINGIPAGSGFSMGAISATTSTSLMTTLVNGGFLSRQVAGDSVFGTDEYYLGIASDGRYQVYAKLERPENSMTSGTLTSLPSGSGALASGYNYGFGAGAGAGASGGVVASSTAGGGAPAAVTLSLTSTLPSVVGSQSFTLNWSSTNATSSCVASNGWSGTKANSGSLAQTIGATSTFTLFCGNSIVSGTGATSSVTVNYVPPAQSNPSAFSISQVANHRTFTASWTAGSANGGAGGCKLQYNSDSGWQNVASPATINCDATQSGVAIALPSGTMTGVTSNWNGRQMRFVRISDSATLFTSMGVLACSSISGSGSPTPDIDENCDGQWDDSSSTGGACYTCSATTWSYTMTETDYNAVSCGGGVYSSNNNPYDGFSDSTSCNSDRTSRFNGTCYNTGGAGPYYSYRYTTSSCTSSTGSVTDCSICGSSPVTTTYY